MEQGCLYEISTLLGVLSIMDRILKELKTEEDGPDQGEVKSSSLIYCCVFRILTRKELAISSLLSVLLTKTGLDKGISFQGFSDSKTAFW